MPPTSFLPAENFPGTSQTAFGCLRLSAITLRSDRRLCYRAVGTNLCPEEHPIMPWFTVILAALQEAPTVAAGLNTFFTHLHNEMAHGSGQTNPLAVTQQVLDGASAIIGAITSNTVAAAEAPAPVSEAAMPAATSEAGGEVAGENA